MPRISDRSVLQGVQYIAWKRYASQWSVSSERARKRNMKEQENILDMEYVFFWVFPRRLRFKNRRFGTLSVPSA
jgi:hypothetical protein